MLCGLEFKRSSVGVIRKGMVINSSNCCGVIFGSAALGGRERGGLRMREIQVTSLSSRPQSPFLLSSSFLAAMQSKIGAAAAPLVP